MALTTPLATAEPSGAPQFRALTGTGSDTTQDVLNGLSEVITGDDPNIPGTDNSKLIGSYNASGPNTQCVAPDPTDGSRSCIITKGAGFPSPPPAADPNCNFIRPSGSTNGVRALVRERERVAVAGGQPCLDFARSSADTSQSTEFNGKGLTYIPFGTDAVMYVTRSDSTISRNLNATGPGSLNAIYSDDAPCLATFRALIPQSGSGTRTFFLSGIQVNEIGGAEPNVGTCVSDDDPINPDPNVKLLENTGNLLNDNRHVAPYSIAQWVAQFTKTIDDVTGATLPRNINGIAPFIRNSAAGTITYATRTDSTISVNLPATGAGSLETVYKDSAPCSATFRPLLPPAGSATRAAFLSMINTPEGQVGNCVTTVSAENNGTLMSDSRNILPYDIDAWLRQLGGVDNDVRGLARIRNEGGVVPFLLNQGSSLTRPVFNVVPTSKLNVAPTSTVFVGGSSAVCNNSAVIRRFGFGTRTDCGDTSRQTPGGPSLP